MDAKTWATEIKAEPLTTVELDNWLAGKRARRILVVPFGGPLPGGKAGLDLDGDAFDADSDLYGDYPALLQSRERLVDWHHDDDPTGVMKGAILGRIMLDEQPEAEGVWADFWANAGERRRNLVAQLEKAGVPLYGSSQAITGGIRKSRMAEGGNHIDRWPLIRHTITTSPQNIWATVPALKALLSSDTIANGSVSVAAIHAAMLGLEGSAPIAPDPIAGVGNAPGNASDLTPRQRARLLGVLSELERIVP